MNARNIAMQRRLDRNASALIDLALPTTLALRETTRRGSAAHWSQDAKNRLYDRMFPAQGGSRDDDPAAHA